MYIQPSRVSHHKRECLDNVRTRASKFSVYNVSEHRAHNVARMK